MDVLNLTSNSLKMLIFYRTYLGEWKEIYFTMTTQLNILSPKPKILGIYEVPHFDRETESATWCKPTSEGQPYARGSFHCRVWVEFDVSNLTSEAKVVSTISTHDLQVAVEKSYLCTGTHLQTIIWKRQNKKHTPCMDKKKIKEEGKRKEGEQKMTTIFRRLQLILHITWKGSM